jgi:hypothetical protein
VTPTNNFLAPIAHKIEVALGARDTIRKPVLCLGLTTEELSKPQHYRVPVSMVIAAIDKKYLPPKK